MVLRNSINPVPMQGPLIERPPCKYFYLAIRLPISPYHNRSRAFTFLSTLLTSLHSHDLLRLPPSPHHLDFPAILQYGTPFGDLWAWNIVFDKRFARADEVRGWANVQFWDRPGLRGGEKYMGLRAGQWGIFEGYPEAPSGWRQVFMVKGEGEEIREAVARAEEDVVE